MNVHNKEVKPVIHVYYPETSSNVQTRGMGRFGRVDRSVYACSLYMLGMCLNPRGCLSVSSFPVFDPYGSL